MPLRLTKESIEEIKRQAREGYPLECGGFLAGKNRRVLKKSQRVIARGKAPKQSLVLKAFVYMVIRVRDCFASLAMTLKSCFSYFCRGLNTSGKEITAVYPMKNLNSHQPRIRFEIDPREFQRLEAEATKDGLQLLVFYHTHPDSPLKTNPSAFDRERAEGLSTFWPDLSYLIVSVDKGKEFQLASWVFNPAQGGFEKEEIEVV